MLESPRLEPLKRNRHLGEVGEEFCWADNFLAPSPSLTFTHLYVSVRNVFVTFGATTSCWIKLLMDVVSLEETDELPAYVACESGVVFAEKSFQANYVDTTLNNNNEL